MTEEQWFGREAFPQKKYNEIYDKAMDFLKEVNPCKIENGTCIRGRNGGHNFCCDEDCAGSVCIHLKKNGCSATKPLPCRLWLCNYAKERLTKKQYEKYIELKKLAGPIIMSDYYVRLSMQEIKEKRLKQIKNKEVSYFLPTFSWANEV